MLHSTGKFSVRSAWEYIRQKGIISKTLRSIWLKGVPFKISFLIWGLWKKRLPIGEVISNWGAIDNMNCYCCEGDVVESYEYLFMECSDSK